MAALLPGPRYNEFKARIKPKFERGHKKTAAAHMDTGLRQDVYRGNFDHFNFFSSRIASCGTAGPAF